MDKPAVQKMPIQEMLGKVWVYTVQCMRAQPNILLTLRGEISQGIIAASLICMHQHFFLIYSEFGFMESAKISLHV